MYNRKRFVSFKAKTTILTLIPIIISFSLICLLLFTSLFNALHETAKAEFLQISQKYAVSFESEINNAMNYLSIIADTLALELETGTADRELLQKTVFSIFNSYGLIDGSSIYFEPNAYDGKDSEYVGSQYGTESSGRICYYFYKDGDSTAYLPEALENDIEFDLPHYTEAKKANHPVYTEPAVYQIDGREIPMFTLTYPVNDVAGQFVGAVTVDLFLEDVYMQIQNENIYDTGYVVISNDKNQVIYSPRFEDTGKTREEAGLNHALPLNDDISEFSNGNSIINGKESLVATDTIYIPQLDSRFYISVSAPTAEINAGGLRLMTALILFSTVVIMLIALLLYYLIGKVSAPIKALTDSTNKIANGDIDGAAAFIPSLADAKTVDEVYILSETIRKMLSQLEEMQNLKLNALKLTHEKETAEASAQAKNDFLAKMSHEIRTPMNAVMGMTELMLRKNLPPDAHSDALIIKSASINLLSIINDILDFSKIESGKLEVIETEYLFPSLINDVINVIRIRLIDKPVQFAVYVDSNIPMSMIGDEIRIRQIITNLLSNAVKYTNSGYISLTVRGVTDGGSVTLTIEVEDSGVGIKDEDIGKLFSDFVQIDAVNNKGIVGTGLGLSIARNLCRLMGGDITLRSEYGKGSVFTATLPQRFESYRPFASVNEPEAKSVLLYETRPIYRDSVRSALEELGVEIMCVENIPSLFEHLEEYRFVFISSFMYGSVNPVLPKLDNPPVLVLLADVTESLAPKDARVLTLPAYSLSVANILNDVHRLADEPCIQGASFIAPEARVLIVDDVMANLKVGEGLLSPYEMQVTLCTNGRDALRLVADNRYDLIFMDHMMPEMDGLEVTRHIREMDGDYFKTLPIVALTANAVFGVHEMFIQNGMNDFLAKPIETSKLDAILDKWIPKNKRGKKTVSEQQEEINEFVEALKSTDGLSVDRAMRVVGGSAKTYEHIIRLSVRLLPENIERLNRLADTDLPGYMIEVHGVKGVLNNMGAYSLGTAALELEELARRGDFESCGMLHPVFIKKLTVLHTSLKALADKHDTERKADGGSLPLRNILPKLAEAADFYDSALALEVLSSVNGKSFGNEADEAVAELTLAFEHFDFDKALEWIEKLNGMLLNTENKQES